MEGARVDDITGPKVKERVQVREEAEDVPIIEGVGGVSRVGGVTANRVQVKAGMKALYLNARSIRNKVDELVEQIDTNGHDLVAITEMWLQGDRDWELNVQGYQVFRKDRQEGKGGGVALLIKDSIKVGSKG